MPDLPPGWTDEMTVPLPEWTSVAEVTELVVRLITQTSGTELLGTLQSSYGVSEEDADLIRDRVCGGVVRAATGNPANRPSREKDPFAWTSFGMATENPTIIVAMYPEFASRDPKPDSG